LFEIHIAPLAPYITRSWKFHRDRSLSDCVSIPTAIQISIWKSIAPIGRKIFKRACYSSGFAPSDQANLPQIRAPKCGNYFCAGPRPEEIAFFICTGGAEGLSISINQAKATALAFVVYGL
jgi:hypothetical protein